MVMPVNALAIRLGAMAARTQSRQGLDKGAVARPTKVTTAMDDEHARDAQVVEMTRFAAVFLFAVEAYASTARTRYLDAPRWREVDVELILALACERPIPFNVDSVIHRGHGGALEQRPKEISEKRKVNLYRELVL